MGKVTKDTTEEAKEDTEVRRVTKEEKGGIQGGIKEEVTKEAKEQVKQARDLSPTPKGPATDAAVRDISP